MQESLPKKREKLQLFLYVQQVAFVKRHMKITVYIKKRLQNWKDLLLQQYSHVNLLLLVHVEDFPRKHTEIEQH